MTDKVEYDDTAVKVMVYPAIIFLMIGMLIGTFISYNAFVFPDYFAGEYITFGRLRPMHVWHVAGLFLFSADVGLLYFVFQRLCGVRLWSSNLARATAVVWWFSLIVCVYSFPFGTNWGWEYAELPMWVGPIPTKALVALAWVMVSVNLIMTIVVRRHEKMYVSLWYGTGAIIWTTFTFVAGNFGLLLFPEGISRVNVNLFYVHNLVGLIFTPMGVAIAYFIN